MLNLREIERLAGRFELQADWSAQREIGAEVLIDCSLSMTTDAGIKEEFTKSLALLIVRLASKHRDAQVIGLRGRGRNIVVNGSQSDRIPFLPFDAPHSEAALLDCPESRSANLRVVLSDFLFPDLTSSAADRSASDSDQVWWLQVVGKEEREPDQTSAPSRIVDLETEEHLDCLVNRELIENYLVERSSHFLHVQQICAQAGVRWIDQNAVDSLSRYCEANLVPAGIFASVDRETECSLETPSD